MDKKFIQFSLIGCFFIFITIIFSCSNLTVPKKITFQADPEIQASLGKIETSLTDYFSVEKIVELVGENEVFSIYDYKYSEDDDVLRFLAQVDYSMEIPGLDVEGNLKDLESMDPISFGYKEDGVTPSVLFSIPEINETIDINPISLEITDNITDSIKDFSAISFQGVQPGMIENLENQNIPYLLELCDDEFQTVTFGEGTFLDIGFNQISSSSVAVAQINRIAIFDAKEFIGDTSIKDFNNGGGILDVDSLFSIDINNAITYEQANSDLITGENLTTSLDLSNKTLPKDICLILTVSFEGGTGNSPVTITTTDSKFSNVSFTRITGFNTMSPIIVDIPTIDPIELISDVEGLVGATIGDETSDGEISFAFTNLPSGVTHTTNLSLVQSDVEFNSVNYLGLNINNQTVTDNKISLAGQSLNTNPINFAGSITIEAENADIDFTEELKVSTNVEIKKFSSVVLESSIIPQDVLEQSYSYPLGEIAEYVNQITFNEVGLALKLCNGLPFAASMNVTSNFLGINGNSYDFNPNQTELPSEATKITSENLVRDIDTNTNFDLAIDLSLPSANGVTTIPNVTTGTDYKFYGQAELIIDWESVNFKLPDDANGFSGSFPEEGDDSLDFSSITDIFGKNIILSGIKPNLYLSSDLLEEEGPLAGAKVNVAIKSTYTEGGNLITNYLVGSEDQCEELKIVDFPTLTPDENSLVIGELPTPSLELLGLTDSLLSGAPDLKIEYDVKLSGSTADGDLSTGITIEKSSLDNLSQSSELKMIILIDIPIALTVKANENACASFDIMALMKNSSENSSEENEDDVQDGNSSEDIITEEPEEESDLFNRGEGEEMEGISDIFEFIKKASINIDYTNETGLALTLVIKDTNDKGQTFAKTANLKEGNGKLNLSFDVNDAEYIKNTNPFYPDVLEIQIPGDKTEDKTYEIKRNASLDVILQASIKTDIDYTINLENPEADFDSEGEN